MVCVLCILPPILLAIYIKFIQPIILRLLPESWRNTFDSLLYPTCPIRTASAQDTSTTSNKAPDVHDREIQERVDYDNCPGNSKKDE
ncbi:hypothetical protein ACH3XW_26160 [Acanthocheilonema viteae]